MEKVVLITNSTRCNQKVTNLITGNSKEIKPGESAIIDRYSLGHYYIYRQYILKGLKYDVVNVAIDTTTQVSTDTNVMVPEEKSVNTEVEVKESPIVEDKPVEEVKEEKKTSGRRSKADKSAKETVEHTEEVDNSSIGGEA